MAEESSDTSEVPRLLVLPKDTTSDARLLTLQHPRTLKPSRFLFDPTQGIFEFTKIAAPKAACRSWLVKSKKPSAASISATSDSESQQEQSFLKPSPQSNDDFVSQTPSLLVATPYDPLFLLLSVMAPSDPTQTQSATPGQASRTPSKSSTLLFRAFDDLIDLLNERSPHFQHILANDRFREYLESRLRTICDTVEAGDEQMYRLNEDKLWAELLRKARRMICSGSKSTQSMPASMEEAFIRRPLDVPVASIPTDINSSDDGQASMEAGESSTPASLSTSTSTISIASASLSTDTQPSEGDSQFSIASVSTKISVPPDSPSQPESRGMPADSEHIAHLLRIHTSLQYLINTYLPPTLCSLFLKLLSSSSSSPTTSSSTEKNATPASLPDFTPLHKHLTHLTALRSAAQAARSLGDFSRKRAGDEDLFDDDNEMKRRKREAEESKKAKERESRALRDLKKADITGMKSLKSFFTAKPAAAKASPATAADSDGGGLRRSPRKK